MPITPEDVEEDADEDIDEHRCTNEHRRSKVAKDITSEATLVLSLQDRNHQEPHLKSTVPITCVCV